MQLGLRDFEESSLERCRLLANMIKLFHRRVAAPDSEGSCSVSRSEAVQDQEDLAGAMRIVFLLNEIQCLVLVKSSRLRTQGSGQSLSRSLVIVKVGLSIVQSGCKPGLGVLCWSHHATSF